MDKNKAQGFWRSAKELAQRIIEVVWLCYLYLIHWWLGGIVAMLLSIFTKRETYDWYERIVLDFTRWSEDKISEWDEHSENTL